MSIGLIALLDDVAALAKVAAASLDDVAGQAAKAGAKAAGVVIDDAAVTPRYVVGFAANREIPIVRRIAIGSLRNKLLYLLPAALAFSLFAPWAITPLLMLGGAYLCFEGAEKVAEAIGLLHHADHDTSDAEQTPTGPAFEDEKVQGAIRTDFVLSAEIMAITLGSLADSGFATQVVGLAAVGVGITIAVYGAVALIVKADDAGVVMARSGWAALRILGRGLVLGMPPFLKLLGIVGTAAMVWVGGGILIHGLEQYGVTAPAHLLHDAAAYAGALVPAMGGAVEWGVGAGASGVAGLMVGAVVIPLAGATGALVVKVRGG
jgi:predicted DNA repair protein MutK